MTKRTRPEEDITDLPPDNGEDSSEAISEEGPKFNQEGLTTELTTVEAVGEAISEEGVTVLEEVAAAELAAEEEVDDGSIWYLLMRAGYTRW